ncbi:MAG TPA: hypothetical protein DDY12_05740 [Porphyromonadaceae bacterium]|nr:hypothetical protein [Porphyromonadaceae bacterium]
MILPDWHKVWAQQKSLCHIKKGDALVNYLKIRLLIRVEQVIRQFPAMSALVIHLRLKVGVKEMEGCYSSQSLTLLVLLIFLSIFCGSTKNRNGNT